MTKVLCEFKDCLYMADWNDDAECGVCSKEQIYLSSEASTYVGCDDAEWEESIEE